MSAFEESCVVEAEAVSILRPYLMERSGGQMVLTNKGTLARWLQESVGDVLINDASERLYAIELKAERRHTGNLFIEEWSNRNLESRESHAERGSNPGWLLKIKADLLLYYFLDTDTLYSIDVFWLKRWAFGYGKEPGNLHKFPQVTQRKYSQANDTVGRLVSVQALFEQLKRPAIKVTTVRQRELVA